MTRRKRYGAEFKREAPRRANEEYVTDTLVAEELGFSTRQLRRWRDEAKKHGEEAFPGKGKRRCHHIMNLRQNAGATKTPRSIHQKYVLDLCFMILSSACAVDARLPTP